MADRGRARPGRVLEDEVVTLDQPAVDHTIRFEDCPRWVRVVFAGTIVADSKQVKLMLEPERLPVYYFPVEDVRMDVLERSDHSTDSRSKGAATYWTVHVGNRLEENAAWSYEDPPAPNAQIKDYIAFYWHKMDAWFEEDDEVFVHPRHPYNRVDVMSSSRHIKIELDGVTLAETHKPRLLFETTLPTRYYIPKLDVRMELLRPTDTTTACPYKGRAVYWSAEVNGTVHENIVWSYPAPIPECPKIENLLCFFNERVDIWVDGELQKRPSNLWSKGITSYG